MKELRKFNLWAISLFLFFSITTGCSLDGLHRSPGGKPNELESLETHTLKKEFVPVAERLKNIVAEHGGHDIALDLSDDDEYAYLMERIAWSNTRGNSPQLYRKIEELREKHLERQRDGTRAEGDDSDPREVPEGNGHFISILKVSEDLKVEAQAHGSVFEGFNYLYMDIIVWDKDWKEKAPFKSVECASGTCQYEEYENNERAPTLDTDHVLVVDDKAPWSGIPNPSIRADTMLIYEDINGNFHIEYAVKELNAEMETYLPSPVLEMTIEAPAHKEENIGNEVVTVCLQRSNPLYCDHWHDVTGVEYVNSNRRGHVLLPFKGHITFAYPMQYKTENGVRKPDGIISFRTALTLGQAGGIVQFTEFDDLNDFFWDHAWVDNTDTSILHWDMSGGPGGTDIYELLDYGPKLLNNSNRVNLFMEIQVNITKSATFFPATAFIVPADYNKEDYEDIVPNPGDYESFDKSFVDTVFGVDEGQIRDVKLKVVGHAASDSNPLGEGGWHLNNPIVYKWTIDREAPVAEIFNAPPAITSTAAPEITIAGDGVVAYRFKVDKRFQIIDGPLIEENGGGFGDQYDVSEILDTEVTPGNLTGLEWFEYILSVVGIDRAGNQQGIPSVCTWKIYPSGDSDGDGAKDIVDVAIVPYDNTPWDGYFPSFHTNLSEAILEVDTTGLDDDFRYQLNDKPMVEMIDPALDIITLTGLVDGMYTLKVWGKVSDGDSFDLDIEPTTITWTVDTSAPVIDRGNLFIPMTTDNITSCDAIQVELAGDDIWTYSFSLDTSLSTWTVEKPVNKIPNIEGYTDHLIIENGLTEGKHTLYVQAKDQSGNLSNIFEYGWNVIDTNEYAVFLDVPAAVTQETNIHAEMTGNINHYSFCYWIKTHTDNVGYDYLYTNDLDNDDVATELGTDWTMAIPLGGSRPMYPLCFIWSCLADDSLITMADGSYREIQDVVKGDLIMARSLESGRLIDRMLPVLEVTIGVETIPMYRIIDQDGRSLLLTQGHPVVMADNTIKLSKNLKPGDMVMTDAGPSSLVIVATEMYNRTIYNLTLGTKEEYLDRGEESVNLMFAEGFLVGDNTLQIREMEEAIDPPKDVFETISDDWIVDYRNYLDSISREDEQ